jgi:bifunctional non-homologous end joining protein LigD
VVEVFYRGIGGQKLLRQASLKAVRADKDIADLEDSDRAGKAMPSGGQHASSRPGAEAKKSPATGRTPPAFVPGKILFPGDGYTKQEVWDYYAAVMEHLLPEVADRPLSIIRCPSGTAKPCFFQKHHTAGLELVDPVRLKEEAASTPITWWCVTRPACLNWAVQRVGVPPWGSHAEAPDKADRVVFDLDQDRTYPLQRSRKRQPTSAALARLQLESFLRVSGGKGLHVVVPLNRDATGTDQALCEGLRRCAGAIRAQRFLATAPKASATSGSSSTTCATGAVRRQSRPSLQEAGRGTVPIAWGDPAKLKRADAFTIKDVPAKLNGGAKTPGPASGK